jgi:branched-chain amino acid transport system ATP-binding protein
MKQVYGYFPVLLERKGQLAGTLSGGEQQMLAIGRGLMSNPDLFMLDEPSLGLSPLMVQEIFSIIKEIYRKGKTILLVEQNTHLALNISDRAYVLENGQIVLEGSGKDLLINDKVKKAYLGF